MLFGFWKLFSSDPTQPNPWKFLENTTQPNQLNPWVNPTHVHVCGDKDDKWMRRWFETRLVKLTKWIWSVMLYSHIIWCFWSEYVPERAGKLKQINVKILSVLTRFNVSVHVIHWSLSFLFCVFRASVGVIYAGFFVCIRTCVWTSATSVCHRFLRLKYGCKQQYRQWRIFNRTFADACRSNECLNCCRPKSTSRRSVNVAERMPTIKTSGLLAGRTASVVRQATTTTCPLAHIIICSRTSLLPPLPWQINLFFYQFSRSPAVECGMRGWWRRRRHDSLNGVMTRWKSSSSCLTKQIGRRRTWPQTGDISVIQLLRMRGFA